MFNQANVRINYKNKCWKKMHNFLASLVEI